MNKILTLFVVICLLAIGTANAQEQLKHEKRTYIAPNGNLYIQKQLPLYLWVSTDKSESSDKILLKSKISEKYTNPFYLDTEGKNTVRSPHAVDPKTMQIVYPLQDVIFEVYADGIAPRSSSSFTGAPKYYGGGVLYYGKGLVVNLSSTDAVSGVEKTYYSIDGNNYQNYTGTLQMNNEKAYVLKYYASDNVGNAENPNEKKYTVDLTAPKSNHSVTQPKLNDIISPKATISLSFTDNLSGVKNTKYYFDSRTPLGYYKPITLWSLTDGDHTLTYYSTDNVLNEEQKVVYKFYLDKIPPVVSQKIVGDQFFGNCKYVSSRTTIDLSATDNKAGVDKIYYSIDGGAQQTYGTPFKVPTRDGRHTIAYWGIDKVTNLASKQYLTVCMDNTAPATSISYGSPQFFDRDTLFINKLTKVTLTPRDYGSGVLKTEYNINDGSNSTYSTPFTIPEEGNKKIEFFSTDKVNNVEAKKTSRCFVDNTPPKIFVNFSIEPIDKKDGLNVYPNYTRLYVGATDVHVGTKQILYSVNGAPLRDYSSPYTLDMSEVSHFLKKNKKYTVKVVAKDKLDNQSEKTIEFFVTDK
jgi:hypothetical protein